MTIADKLTQIAERLPIVYDAGQDAGRMAEYDRFWDTLQNNGNAKDYSWCFTGASWTDDIYKPKYPFICTNSFNLFRNSRITDIKVPVDISRCTSSTHNFCFEVPYLVRIPKLIVSENTALSYSIYACANLEEIRFEGKIGKSLDLHFSKKLSAESYKSILDCMIVSVTNQTLTIPTTAEAVYDAKYGSGKWAEREADKNNLGWAFSYI